MLKVAGYLTLVGAVFTAAGALTNLHADDARTVSASDLAANPDAYKRQTIRVRRVRCASVPSGILCEVDANPYVLRIDAITIGALTSGKAAERLAEACKGKAALDKSTCTFDALFVPQTSEITSEYGVSTVTVKVREIDVL